MMIEAAPAPMPSGRAMRRLVRFYDVLEAAPEPAIRRDDVQFFLGAYLGALVFFLAWLA